MAVEKLQHFLHSEVILSLGPESATMVRWGKSRLPTLVDVEPLRPLVQALALNDLELLSDVSPATLFESSDGNWTRLVPNLNIQPCQSSMSQRAEAFRLHVWPSLNGAPSTRLKAWSCWRGILTWGVARRCLMHLLPMPLVALESLLWDLVSLQCSFSIIKGYIDCIQARHRSFNLPSPISGSHSYLRLSRGLQRFQGRQRRFKYPIHKSMVASMLRYTTDSWVQLRNCLAASLATVCCLRPSEGAALQSCDVFFDFDSASGRPGYHGTAAINIKSRKNDQLRKGHHPRIGRPYSRLHDLVHQLHCFMEEAGLAPRPNCTKQASPHARCPICPPLFPLTVHTISGFKFTNQHPSPDKFSSWILAALCSVGVDTTAFSGVSARRGGLSTAIEAGVPEIILWMQSGHAQSRAARSYVALQSPSLLYKTWDASDL
jgi:hypothetical protein